MNDTLRSTIGMVAAIQAHSQMKASRNFLDLFSDRVRQAATESTMLAFGERLSALVNASVGSIPEETVTAFIMGAAHADADAVLGWLRTYPRIATMVAALRTATEREDIINTIVLQPCVAPAGAIPARAEFDIGIKVDCLSPLAHGADGKAGNATLFRRMNVLTSGGAVLSLPYYAGNALRGQLRDALADHLLRQLGLKPSRSRPPLSLWFFHVLYAGGALEDNSEATKRMSVKFGKAPGVLRTDALREFRDLLPCVSLLGCALGNRVLPGRVQVGDLRPRCAEWGTGTKHVGELMEWTFLTRREDLETHAENTSMIATTETLKLGTVMDGGIDVDTHVQDVELAALARGLLLVQERGRIGAENRRDLGSVRMEFSRLPDPAPYDAFLVSRKAEVLKYLSDVGAMSHAPSEPDFFGAVEDLAGDPGATAPE